MAEDNPVRAIDVFVGELDLAGLGFGGVEPEATGQMLWKVDVRYALNSRHSAIRLRCPLCAKSRLMHRNKKGDLFDHLSAHVCAGSFGQPRLPKALNQFQV